LPSEAPKQNNYLTEQYSVPLSPKFWYSVAAKEDMRLGKSVDLPHGIKGNNNIEEDIDPY